MNFEEVMNLLRTFSLARFKDSAEVPKVHVYDNQLRVTFCGLMQILILLTMIFLLGI
jgi:hypothetical protein